LVGESASKLTEGADERQLLQNDGAFDWLKLARAGLPKRIVRVYNAATGTKSPVSPSRECRARR
jgi:hypothetical protein